MSSNTINIPNVPFLGPGGTVSDPWLQWLINPSVRTIVVNGGIPYSSGGTGIISAPPVGALLVGTGSGYVLSTTLPTTALPALTGDVTSTAGSSATTLATVNASPGAYGTGTKTATITVNAKGLVTASSQTSITGSDGSFTVTAGFGCNGKTAQTSASVNAAIAGTAGATYTATEQGLINSLLALVNQLRAALVANGIAV